MQVERVRVDDLRIAGYRDVSDGELLRARGLFVAEGRLVVRRIVEDRRHLVRSVLLSETARRALEPALEARAPDVPVYVCDVSDLLALTGFTFHRGCLALVERPAARTVEEVLRPADVAVVLEGVANADNMGGVFRNAAAFGAGAVLLDPACCDPLYRKAVRTSMAATLRVPFARLVRWPDQLADIRREGFRLVALTPREGAEPIDAFASRPRASKLALLVGAEGSGLSPAVEASADCRVSIPIRRDVDSLNLAVATGIALHLLARRT